MRNLKHLEICQVAGGDFAESGPTPSYSPGQSRDEIQRILDSLHELNAPKPQP